MKSLSRRVEIKRRKNLKRTAASYALARELGFTSQEAAIMAHWSKDRIRQFKADNAKKSTD